MQQISIQKTMETMENFKFGLPRQQSDLLRGRFGMRTNARMCLRVIAAQPEYWIRPIFMKYAAFWVPVG